MKKKELEKELAKTLSKLEALAYMVVGLPASGFTLPHNEERYLVILESDLDPVLDYAHNDILRMKSQITCHPKQKG